MDEERFYLIIPTSEVYKIDFNLICETSPETLRKTNNGEKTFIKWTQETPEFVFDLEKAEGPYSHDEILEILKGPEWNDPLE